MEKKQRTILDYLNKRLRHLRSKMHHYSPEFPGPPTSPESPIFFEVGWMERIFSGTTQFLLVIGLMCLLVTRAELLVTIEECKSWCLCLFDLPGSFQITMTMPQIIWTEPERNFPSQSELFDLSLCNYIIPSFPFLLPAHWHKKKGDKAQATLAEFKSSKTDI